MKKVSKEKQVPRVKKGILDYKVKQDCKVRLDLQEQLELTVLTGLKVYKETKVIPKQQELLVLKEIKAKLDLRA